MPVLVEESSSNSTFRRPRNEMSHHQQHQHQAIESARAKLATPKKKLNSTFRGFGCTAAASQQVSLPAVIRSSADWDASKKVKKKKQMSSSKKIGSSSGNNDFSNNSNSNSNSNINNNNNNSSSNLSSYGVGQDVWCGPGIGFSGSDAVVGSVDCVVTTRKNVVSGRGKIDNHRERDRERDRDRDRERSCLSRRTVTPEFPFPDFDAPFAPARSELEVFGPRHYRHIRHSSPDGLAEIMMLQNSLMTGGRVESHDHFRDWRLDVDSMSYEELLELGDRIGYVSTGLKDDEIGQCLRKLKNSILSDLSSHLPKHVDKKCTICQEEYEAGDEVGKLDCGHGFHVLCIKQWVTHKNACPVCKAAVINRH